MMLLVVHHQVAGHQFQHLLIDLVKADSLVFVHLGL